MNQDLLKFFYKDKIYSVDSNQFRNLANYEIEQGVDYHFLTSEFEGDLSLTEEIIQSFFNFFQNQTITITTHNVLILNYLSHKYQILNLCELTENFIRTNSNDIFNCILTNNQNGIEVENFFSSNILNFIDDDRLFNFTIFQLHRIMKKYTENTFYNDEDDVKAKKEEEETKIIYFIIRLIQRKGIEGNILFSLFEFSEKGRQFLNQTLQFNLKLFDFNFAFSNLIKRSNDNDIEYQEQERKLQEKYDSLSKQFQQKIQEIEKKFQEKYDTLEKKSQEKYDSLENEFQEKYNTLENEFHEKYDSLEKKSQEKYNTLENEFHEKYDSLETKSQEKYNTLENEFHEKYTSLETNSQEKYDSLENEFQEKYNTLEKKSQEKYDTLETNSQEKYDSLENEFQEKYDSLEKKSQRKYDTLENEFQEKYDTSKKKFQEERIKENNRIEQLNKTIYNVNSSKYFYRNDYEAFNKLKCESQTMIILGLNDENPDNKTIQNISSILQYLSEEQQKSNYRFNQIKYIQIETNNKNNKLFENDENQKLIIPIHVFKMLHTNKSIQSEKLINIINKFDEIHTKIHLPSTDDEIFNIIMDMKKSNKINLKVDIIISKIDEQGKTFQYNKYIDSVEIEAPVTNIYCVDNKGFFEGCSLTKVTIPFTITRICKRAFKYCYNLKEITIPPSVNFIEECTFEECESLNKINIQSDIRTISNYMFKGCSSLTQITIPSSVTSIGDSAFYKCSSLTQITIPSSVTSIGDSAFSECSSLTQITIPSSVTSIGDSAFSECSSLTQITIPSSVTSIGDSAFSECISLTQITIPSSVTSIGNKVFNGIKSLTINGDTQKIFNCMFKRCSSLTQITIPSSVTSIGESAFFGCSLLTQITIPSSVTSIGDSAFFGCSSLTQITNYSSVDLNIIKLAFMNKKNQDKPFLFKIQDTATMQDVKKNLLRFFHTLAKSTITEFILVREGPPEDAFNDAIEDNYFDDKYNNETIRSFLKINEDKRIYTEKHFSVPLIYFRAIKLKLNIRILNKKTEMMISLPLRLDNSYSALISDIQKESQLAIKDPYHIYQDNQNLDEISKEENMKKYSKTGLILFLYPIQARFINKSDNSQTTIILKHDKPLSFYLPKIYQQLMNESYSTNCIVQIQDQQKCETEKIGIDIPIHQILKKQKKEPVIFEIFED